MELKEYYRKADAFRKEILDQGVNLEAKTEEIGLFRRARLRVPKEIKQEAVNEIFDVTQRECIELSEDLIKLWYRTLYASPAEYRRQDFEGKTSEGSPYQEISRFMSHYIGQIHTSKKMFHAIEFAVYVYKRFLDILPFQEYNQEIAELLLNLLLLEGGYGVTFISPKMLEGYEAAMKGARNASFPEMDGLVLLVTRAVIKSEETILRQ